MVDKTQNYLNIESQVKCLCLSSNPADNLLYDILLHALKTFESVQDTLIKMNSDGIIAKELQKNPAGFAEYAIKEAAAEMQETKPNTKSIDSSNRILASGKPVPEDNSHTELKENGQQKEYVVLSPEERAKGFVRPLRTKYIHVGTEPVYYKDSHVLIKLGTNGCGNLTKMSLSIAETYAANPKFYSSTFCCGCNKHLPLDQFVWEGTNEIVGS
jgi:hypothetical protein